LVGNTLTNSNNMSASSESVNPLTPAVPVG